jgi:O-acetyl-ADP-ribose deacetylase (regulator of RNase III)
MVLLMIRYTRGNLLEASAEALVNTVNEVGVMGKGIALMFRDTFPENTKQYEFAAKAGQVQVGKMLTNKERDLLGGERWIINFPTKKHWRNPSRIDWIREGLNDLVRVIREKGIKSVAVPPLGCGNGGLDWQQVRSEIESRLSGLKDVDVIVYEPTTVYHHTPKREGLQELTPSRALIAELVRRYLVLGLDCTNLEVQKLAWFLNRMIEKLGLTNPLGLRYQANKYGPYADNLRHLLNGLDGSYLHCEKRLADASPYDLIHFEDAKRRDVEAYLHGDHGKLFLPALEETSKLIDGFESPLGMELLSTVDWIVSQTGYRPTLVSVKEGLAHWPGGSSSAKRKLRLFDDRLITLAVDRLNLLWTVL